jgi:mono/diheme cytochrome c family protein
MTAQGSITFFPELRWFIWLAALVIPQLAFAQEQTIVKGAVSRARRTESNKWRFGFIAIVLLAVPIAGYSQAVTAVEGESWLEHLHRSFYETSMGQSSGGSGPRAPMPSEWPLPRPSLAVSPRFTGQGIILQGQDLFRFKCQGCHGPAGTGAPPEINSVIDPVRATSAQLYIQRMKALGMDVSKSDASKLAAQAKTLLLDRLHKGGTDMPSPNPYLTNPEVQSLFAYLRQLAGIPGAERQQLKVVEPPLRVGEHIVKSTCHICHASVGSNPNPKELLDGRIPPLNSFTSRLSLNEFVTKVTVGYPVLEGSPPIPVRGHMPVFNYLSADEAGDIYLYLTVRQPKK